jgi:outer membrane receptor protein involved in Fe transport
MRFDANKLSSAVRLALSLGAAATAGTVTAYAQDKDAQTKGPSLETIVVTGSNIRRVDIETASPVVTIDRTQIQASGKVNLGDLVQQLPSMAGAAMNPQVNNGGAGTAGVSLRGLGSNRTLLLINGHRVPFQLQDLNMIPVSAVERIEVLNDGASAVYGSDAIAGVVNIITRTNYQGAEFGADYGIADKDDGERRAIHMLFGQSSDKGNILFGVQYDKQEPVSAANRKVSANAQYLYNSGVNSKAGSSRTPGGRYFLPGNNPIIQQLGCKVSNGVSSVTLSGNKLPSLAGPPSASDFRCYTSATDGFNFQAVGNYDMLPNERTGAFVLGNYKLTDSVEAYTELLYHKMVAHSQLAPYPFDLVSNNVVIPANQYYNPFGVAFGDNGASSTIALRLTSLGNRGLKISNTTELGNVGVKGTFGETSWNWDAHFSYGKLTIETQNLNFLNFSQIVPELQCTTAPGAGNCTPLDIFNQSDPSTLALLKAAKIDPYANVLYQMKEWDASANGTLFSLPAGDAQLALGGSYRKEYVGGSVDPLVQNSYTVVDGVGSFVCPGPNSICSAPAQGGFNVKEAYAELLVPILKDQPFAHSLNIDIGDRYSKYSNFGSTSNWKVAIEYRPIEDLLLRGTVSKVFRAPTPTNLFIGPVGDAPTATDPCAGVSGVSSNKACQGFNVPKQIFSQLTAYVMGSNFANAHGLSTTQLQAENGKSFDYGFVYDPEWIPGLSVNADYFRILLNNLIVSGPGISQTILTDCFNTQSAICSNIFRSPDGSIKFMVESPFNAGNLVDQGLDIGAHYRLPTTYWGNFRVGVDASYIQKYNVAEPGFTQHLAGHFDKTFGNFARVRALATLDWSLGPWVANWTTRYIGRITSGYANQCLGPSAANGDTPDGPNQCDSYIGQDNGFAVQHYGAVTYHNASLGYNIEPINTFVSVGVDNLFDKQPPLLYLNNVINANTDVNTYDLLGRYYHASVTVKF